MGEEKGCFPLTNSKTCQNLYCFSMSYKGAMGKRACFAAVVALYHLIFALPI
jgi:hypothetical protein